MSHTNFGPGDRGVFLFKGEASRSGRRLAGVFLLLAALLVVFGYLYVSHQRAEARRTAHRELSAIADLKLKQIVQWREERLADARFFSRARFAARDVRNLLEQPASESARADVRDWLTLLKGGDRYLGLVIFDSRGERRLALPETASEPRDLLPELLRQVREAHDVIMTDLHRDETGGFIHLDVVFPLFEDADWTRAEPFAYVLLKVEARQFLFPVIQSWPTPSKTGEALLLRRERDHVMYLSDLRHQAGAALNFRLPLNSPGLPAGRVLQGDNRVIEGLDYRGVAVVAAGRLIPGTPWAIGAKMDRAEIYAPLRQQSTAALVMLGALLIACGLLVALLWREHTARFLKQELRQRIRHEREMERVNRLYAAQTEVNKAVLRVGSDQDLLEDICRALVVAGGCRMAWVGWLDEPTARVVPVAHYGDTDGYLQKVEFSTGGGPEARSYVVRAIQDARSYICNDLSECPPPEAGDPADPPAWRSVAVFPIRRENLARGVLAVYASQKDFFGPQERTLIEEAAGDVSFGLEMLLNRQRRNQAEELVRQARDELVRANASLERKVATRTAQLVEANANLQAFAYTAAHDLRAPLRAISSFSAMVSEEYGEKLGPDGLSFLERVVASARQMEQLLSDLLEYSRMSQAELKLGPVKLDTAVAEALALLQDDITSRNAVVRVDAPLPEAIGHTATLVLLITNLVSNALKFIAPGIEPRVHIWGENAGDRVILSVGDKGIGIAAEDLERIFAPFERLHGKSAYPGTGLGLAIVRKGAERMGGRVGVESQPGQGSRFWIELKAVQPTHT